MDEGSEIRAELAEAADPTGPVTGGSGVGDQRVIVGQTGQNVVGLVVGAAATFIAQVLMTHRLGGDLFGVVTLTTQFAFIAAAATRFGMDVANVRLVAILDGRGESARSRGLVRRSTLIAIVVSVPFALIVFAASPWLAETFSGIPDAAVNAFRAAAITIPLAALAFTAMGATRGLKIMRYTLLAQWAAQPIGWIAFALVLWAVAAATAAITTFAFALSWALALAIAWWGWVRERGKFDPATAVGEGIAEEHTGALVRFGALRAPATLFSQLIFWADFFVLSYLMAPLGVLGQEQVGVYGGVLRAGQSLFLFLTSVSLTFSPFVADLHHRGEIGRLDHLYKQVTRWTLAATIPVLLVLAILPAQVLRIFGPEFVEGAPALRILIIGMIVPVMVGTVGFILIMAGRTGWDLMVYVGGFTIDIGLAFVLAQPDVLGFKGAAIAQAITLTFTALARLFLVQRFLDIWPFERAYLRLVAPTAIGAAAMIAVHLVVPEAKWFINLVASAAVGAVAYFAMLLAVGLPANERAIVGKLISKVAHRGTIHPAAG